MNHKKYSFKHLVAAFLFGSLLFSGVVLAMVNPAKNLSDHLSSNQLDVKIVNTKGKEIGHAILTEIKEGVRIHIIASNLSPGKHGFHIHEQAFQVYDFSTAGGHFNPEGKQHGLNNREGYHLGDMVNLVASQDGKVNAEFLIEKATLKKGDPFSLHGRSMIIHAGEDDQQSDPSGNSGDRIAGGNIF